jgi:hypothetical protein
MLAKLLGSCVLAGGVVVGLFVAGAEAGVRDGLRDRDRVPPVERAAGVSCQ